MVMDNVDDVILFLSELKDDYRGNDSVNNFIGRMENDLRIADLKSIKGPSIRRRFARELIRSGVINSKTSILIVGASGTSKTFTAKRIARNSNHPTMILVNCANKPREDLEKALQSAQNTATTILFDEVYALPQDVQELSLAEFGREGLDMRIISTSSTPVDTLKTKLKSDFVNRIMGWIFELRPLAENRPDVEEAIRGFVEETHKMDIEPTVLEHLRDNYSWPDNFRGVERVTEALCRLCKTKDVGKISIEVLIELKSDMTDEVLRILSPLIK
jgi:DNA-binding NtrC family response regulator